MPKLIYGVLLTLLVALLACSGEGPTPAPEPTAVPAAIAAPTAGLPPGLTATPTQQPGESAWRAGERVPGVDILLPLPMNDAEAFLSEISQDERSCLEDNGIGAAQIQRALDSAAPFPADEGDAIIDCLEDDTVLRLFLSAPLMAVGELSHETSQCVRDGLEAVDLRRMMKSTEGQAGSTEAEIAGLASYITVTVCLNDQEWNAAARVLDLGVRDEAGTECLLAELGGPTGLAEALVPEDDSAIPLKFMEAAARCDVAFSPIPGDSPADFGSAGTVGSRSQEDRGLPPDSLAPADVGDPQVFLSGLSPEERSCLSDGGIGPRELQAMAAPAPGNSGETTLAIINCLHDETVLRLFLTRLIGQVEPLSPETSMCIREGFASLDYRGVFAILMALMAGKFPADPTSLSGAELTIETSDGVAAVCLNDAEWETYAPRLGMSPGDREVAACLFEQLGGPAELVEAMRATGRGETPEELIRAAETCDFEGMGLSGDGMPQQQPGTQRVPIDPGPGTSYIDPRLYGLLQRNADGLPVPDNIAIVIVIDGTWTDVPAEPPLDEFIESLGGETTGPDTWELPTDKVVSVIQRPDVYSVGMIQNDATNGERALPQLDETLQDVATAYASGVHGERAVQYAMFVKGDNVAVGVKAPDADTIGQIRTWLGDRNVYVLPASSTQGISPRHLPVLLPVNLITELVSAFPHIYLDSATHRGQGLTLSRAYWTQETLDLENGIVAQYLPN